MSGAVGFYGKLPGAGDFVQRRLPADFVDGWDRHFQRAIEAGRRELGAQWTAAYRRGPAWRFVLPAQVCGQGAWAGLVGPAEDRVGRGFPMVLAAPFGSDAAGILGNEAWFDALEQIYRAAQYEAVSVETFDARVAALPRPLANAPDLVSLWRRLDWGSGQWRLDLPAGAVAGALLAEAWNQLCARPGAWCLWWTQGAGQLLATRGLPGSYAALLEPPSAVAAQADAPPSRPSGESRAGTQRAERPEGGPVGASAASHPVPSVRQQSLDSGFRRKDGDREQHDRQSTDDLAVTTAWRTLPAAKPASAAAPATVARAPAPEPAATASANANANANAALLYLERDSTLLISTDEGAPDPRRRAALSIRATALAGGAPDLAVLQANLLALHARLRAADGESIAAVPEDGAVLAARFEGSQVRLLRIGAAAAWHWRRGRLRPLFVERAAGAGGEFDDLLFGAAWLAMPGLGAAGQPQCDEATGALEAGDRLLLAAGRGLLELAQEQLADALAAPTCEDARLRLAAFARLGPEPAQWPLAVIEIGS